MGCGAHPRSPPLRRLRVNNRSVHGGTPDARCTTSERHLRSLSRGSFRLERASGVARRMVAVFGGSIIALLAARRTPAGPAAPSADTEPANRRARGAGPYTNRPPCQLFFGARTESRRSPNRGRVPPQRRASRASNTRPTAAQTRASARVDRTVSEYSSGHFGVFCWRFRSVLLAESDTSVPPRGAAAPDEAPQRPGRRGLRVHRSPLQRRAPVLRARLPHTSRVRDQNSGPGRGAAPPARRRPSRRPGSGSVEVRPTVAPGRCAWRGTSSWSCRGARCPESSRRSSNRRSWCARRPGRGRSR
jgi:hypothetical protein